jgi:hypothetical protein
MGLAHPRDRERSSVIGGCQNSETIIGTEDRKLALEHIMGLISHAKEFRFYFD